MRFWEVVWAISSSSTQPAAWETRQTASVSKVLWPVEGRTWPSASWPNGAGLTPKLSRSTAARAARTRPSISTPLRGPHGPPFRVRPEVVAQPKKTCVESKRFLVDHRLGEVESLDFITVCQHIALTAYRCSYRRQCHGMLMFESVVGLRDVCAQLGQANHNSLSVMLFVSVCKHRCAAQTRPHLISASANPSEVMKFK